MTHFSRQTERITAIRLLVKYLEAEGVRYVFGIPGGPLMPLYEALYDRGTITPILAKHEQGAAFMADGYARVSGGLGVCCATVGPGATNLMTGVACAYADSIPLLVLTAQVATGTFAKGAAQEGTVHGVDVVDMFKPITKLSTMLVSGEKMSDILKMAIRTALSGRRGPVHINLPADLVKREVTDCVIPPSNYHTTANNFDREAIREASRKLLKAKRPGILLGNGVNLSGAHREVRAVAEKLMIPVATTPKAKGAFPEDHLLSFGVLGMAGSPRAESYFMSGELDVLMVVGSSMGELSTHTWDTRLQPTSCLIQIDIDPKEIGKNYPTQIGVVGDAKACVRELSFQLERDIRWMESLSIKTPEEIRQIKDRSPRYYKEEMLLSNSIPLKPQRLIHELRQWLPEDAILFVDIGNSMMWALHYYPVSQPGTFHLGLGMASMGYATAAVVGAQLAAPDKRVVALVGDAAFAMNGMEVHTAAERSLPIVWIVANNGGHGMVYHGDKILFNGRFNSSRFNNPIDVVKVAEGLGASAFRVESLADIPKALKFASSAQGPVVLDARIDAEEPPPMMLRLETLKKFFTGAVEAKA